MKKIFKALPLVVLSLLLVVTPVLACNPPRTIKAKSLCDAEYNATEWHFVITGIKNESSAPKSIRVRFERVSGVEVVKVVQLDKYTGETAHYTWYGNLKAKVLKAKTDIYAEWDGQFNLSHGPMNCEQRVTWDVKTDCKGWSIEFTRNGEPAGGESGTWKDLTTNETFDFTQSIYGKLYIVTIKERQDCYSACEIGGEVYEIEGPWSDYTGQGIDKKASRVIEIFDATTKELCDTRTEYREKCFANEVVHFWTDGYCMFRDRTYPINASWMVNPPVFAQRAYCGCNYEAVGEWGIVEVNNCDKDGYKYWMELTPYCGFTSCN